MIFNSFAQVTQSGSWQIDFVSSTHQTDPIQVYFWLNPTPSLIHLLSLSLEPEFQLFDLTWVAYLCAICWLLDTIHHFSSFMFQAHKKLFEKGRGGGGVEIAKKNKKKEGLHFQKRIAMCVIGMRSNNTKSSLQIGGCNHTHRAIAHNPPPPLLWRACVPHVFLSASLFVSNVFFPVSCFFFCPNVIGTQCIHY